MYPSLGPPMLGQQQSTGRGVLHIQNVIPCPHWSRHNFGETTRYHLGMGELHELVRKQDRPFVLMF